MGIYRRNSDGALHNANQIIAANPNSSAAVKPMTGAKLTALGYEAVLEGARPSPANRHEFVRKLADPVQDQLGNWVWAYEVVDVRTGMDAEALADYLVQDKAKLKDAVSAKRWAVETGGTTVNGAVIQTDAGSQAKLSGALQLVQADDTVIADWKGADGWVQLNAAAVTAIATAVGLHVQAAFSREKALHDAIDAAADFTALDLIDIEAGSINAIGSW
jgi:hypothetical protein